MANEAILRVRRSDPIDFTCADGVAIEKGTLLQLTGDRTVTATSAEGDFFIGICARDKIANDGRTTVPVFTDGIFDITVDGSNTATLAHPQKMDGANVISDADDDNIDKKAEVVGLALEAGSASEVIQVDIGIR